MRKITIFLVLLLLSAGAYAAQIQCLDLKSKNFIVVYGEKVPLSQVIRESLKGTNWKLEQRMISSEPYVQGEIKGPIEDVITGLVRKSLKKGWKINLVFDSASCTVREEVLNSHAPRIPSGSSVITLDKQPQSNRSYSDSKKRLPVKTTAFLLHKGNLIDQALKSWAERHGYMLIWDMPYTWKVVNDYPINSKDLLDAIDKVVDYLRKQGKPVKATAYTNKVIVIKQDDAIPGGQK